MTKFNSIRGLKNKNGLRPNMITNNIFFCEIYYF